MHRVFHGIGAKSGTDSLGVLHLGLKGVGRTAHCLPFGESVISNEGHTGDHIGLEEVNIVGG